MRSPFLLPELPSPRVDCLLPCLWVIGSAGCTPAPATADGGPPATDAAVNDAALSPLTRIPFLSGDVPGTSEHEPSLAIDRDGEALVLWQAWRPAERRIGLGFSVSHDRGVSWTAPARIEVPTENNIMANARVVADPEGGFVLAWVSQTRTSSGRANVHLWTARVASRGETLSTPVDVSPSDTDIGFYDLPSLLVESTGHIDLAYARGNLDFSEVTIVLAESDDEGATFTASVLAPGGASGSFRNGVDLCFGAAKLRAVWFDDEVGGIAFSERRDGAWTAPELVQQADETARLTGPGSTCSAVGDDTEVFYTLGDAPTVSSRVPIITGLRTMRMGTRSHEVLDSLLEGRVSIIPLLRRDGDARRLLAYTGAAAMDDDADVRYWSSSESETLRAEIVETPVRLETNRATDTWLGDWVDFALHSDFELVAVSVNGSGASRIALFRR